MPAVTGRVQDRADALRLARARTIDSGRVFVVRDDGQRFFVVPLLRGYETFGRVLEESLVNRELVSTRITSGEATSA